MTSWSRRWRVGEDECCEDGAQLIYSVMVGAYAVYVEFTEFSIEDPGPDGGERAPYCSGFSFNVTGAAQRYEIEMIFGQWPVMPPAPNAHVRGFDDIISDDIRCHATL